MRLKNDIYIYEWTNAFDNNCNSYFIGGKVQALIDPGITGYVPDLLKPDVRRRHQERRYSLCY